MSQPSFSPDQLELLKKSISQQLRQKGLWEGGNTHSVGVFEQIENFIQHSGTVSEDQILHELQQTGCLDEITSSVKQNLVVSQAKSASAFSSSNISNQKLKTVFTEERTPNTDFKNSISPHADLEAADISVFTDTTRKFPFTKQLIVLRDFTGKAFIEESYTQDVLPVAHFLLSIHYKNQRFSSHPVQASVEPTFPDCSFPIELAEWNLQANPDKIVDLLMQNTPVHIIVVKKFADGFTTLVGSHLLEWRKILRSGSLGCAVELTAPGGNFPAGVLNFKISLDPLPPKILPDTQINEQINIEKLRATEATHLFFAFAKNWWRDFQQISRSHSSRLVKVFSSTEYNVELPVCAFVKPMRAGRLLDSPRHAARFVSLFEVEAEDHVAGKEIWCTIPTFLAKGRGNVHSHSVLLCSLLLGYGLDAYVCIGADRSGREHVWVLTLGENSVMFWESTSGNRCVINDPNNTKKIRYKTVECVFNDKILYANMQYDPSVSNCNFDFRNTRAWKPMNQESIVSTVYSLPPPLMPSVLQVIPTEMELESIFQNIIINERRSHDLLTHFDDNLSFLLSSALSLYEMERITGTSIHNEEFHQSIRSTVPEGHTFLGFPMQFSHRSPRKMMLAFKKSEVCIKILHCRGAQAKFAVRCKIFAYPEGRNSVWMMIACRFIDPVS